jgi:hypothetical protein
MEAIHATNGTAVFNGLRAMLLDRPTQFIV